MNNVTLSTLRRMKQADEKFTALTAYDAAFARILDEAGVEVLLVGDSLGMVVQGKDTTLPVTMDEMVYHTQMVARGSQRALVMTDMPFLSYATPPQALGNAARLMKEGGAHCVKLEVHGGMVDTVKHLADYGVPVCAHLGLLPQTVHKLGGYKVQGRDRDSANEMLAAAQAMAHAGADLLLLECVPSVLAAEITAAVDIPVIGIGAGPDTDGQVLVLYDMLGITPGKRPKFSMDFLQAAGSVAGAVGAYVQAVKDKRFPGPEHSVD
jgi:3-methyl-2-oxobutanoate hydroxymethyltransferase